MSFLGDLIAGVGREIGAPELGISEKLGSTGQSPNTQQGVANKVASDLFSNNSSVFDPVGRGLVSNGISDGVAGLLVPGGATGGSAALGGGGGGVSASDLAYLDDQASQLRDLLNRTDTGLNQGLQQNQDEYDRQLGGANNQKSQQYANYEDQRVAQNQGKLNTYDTINRNANNAFRSLSQIVGRAAGTGSSAFRDLLPNVVGSDISSKRGTANQTYGSNLQGIDRAQGQFDISFADVLDDLLRQKKTNENTLRTGIEGQRQSLNSQLGTVAAQKAQAQGGGYAQVRAAQQPFQDNINNSRNQVESFFNQFRTAYTPKQAVAVAPELAGYTADRSTINAQNQGVADPTNPYAALLRKRLTGTA